jgi:hypothetical protein
LVWSASVIRCMPTCLSGLMARSRSSSGNSLHPTVSVLSAGTMSHQHP